MNPTQDCIPKIDVRETLSAALTDPECIYTILEAIRQENENVPIEVPPENLFDLMIYVAQREDVYFKWAIPSENTPEKLMPFVKIPKSLQQKILYRSFFVYQLYFKFGGDFVEFPLKFED